MALKKRARSRKRSRSRSRSKSRRRALYIPPNTSPQDAQRMRAENHARNKEIMRNTNNLFYFGGFAVTVIIGLIIFIEVRRSQTSQTK